MFHVCLYYTVLSVPSSLVITCGERSDLLALLCVMFPCDLSLSHWCLGSGVNRFLIFAFFTFDLIFPICLINGKAEYGNDNLLIFSDDQF